MSADMIQQPLEQQFSELLSIINYHRSRASQAVNSQQLLTAWSVGAYISNKLKTNQWGSKVVSQFVEHMKVNAPDIKGYSRRNIYNMVMFFDEYSSPRFLSTVQSFLPGANVQLASAQIASDASSGQTVVAEIVQTPSAQLPMDSTMPKILELISFSNHIAILNQCSSSEERLFYILYAHRERLKFKEVQRCITNDTYTSLLGSKHNLSKGLLQTYPDAPILFKDTVFVDFLGLAQKHSEKRLRMGLVEHMKQFILELGKDFLFVDQEYSLEVGASVFKADLLFFHRGLQALVAVELKRRKFDPRDMGQLEFYLEALDRDVKRTNENPSIGIILCPEADKTVVEYALSRSMSPTMVAEYKRQLIPKEKMQVLLQEYCDLAMIEKKGGKK
jgi:predicted nuclease of restriction endonuclease-like (RecB) superfamily